MVTADGPVTTQAQTPVSLVHGEYGGRACGAGGVQRTCVF